MHKEIHVASKKTVTKMVLDAKLAYLVAKLKYCKQLFHVTDKLLGRHKSSPLPITISLECLPDQFSTYFHDKVAIIKNQLDCGTLHALVSPYNHDTEFHHTPFTSFQPITTDYLHSVVTKCAPKSCELDPIPTSLLLECLDTVLPTMTSIINDSLKSGVFPSIYKSAIVTPLLKKPSLDPNDLKNYRPVSNLSFMSKILEKVVVSQLMSHLNRYNLFQ